MQHGKAQHNLQCIKRQNITHETHICVALFQLNHLLFFYDINNV